jgi:hypothetical protein
MVDRLEMILGQGGEVPTAAIVKLRSAIELVRGGQSCPQPAPCSPPVQKVAGVVSVSVCYAVG